MMSPLGAFKALFQPSSPVNPNLGNEFAWESLRQVLSLASAAQISPCGGVFGVAGAIVEVLKTAQQNDAASRELLGNIQEYSQVLWQFIESMEPEYIHSSADKQADHARTSIKQFVRGLDAASGLIKKYEEQHPFLRIFFSAKLRTDFDDCNARLNRSLAISDSTKSTIQLDDGRDTKRMVMELSRQPSPTSQPTDPFKILGAKLVSHENFKNSKALVKVSSRLLRRQRSSGGFWSMGVFEAEVEGVRSLVKVYDRKKQEAVFIRDLELFSKNVQGEGLPTVRAYCLDAENPFIAFKTKSVIPWDIWMNKIPKTSPDCAFYDELREKASHLLSKGTPGTKHGSQIGEMFSAGRFLNLESALSSSQLRRTIENAQIDDQGRVILAPESFDSPYESPIDGGRRWLGRILQEAWPEFAERFLQTTPILEEDIVDPTILSPGDAMYRHVTQYHHLMRTDYSGAIHRPFQLSSTHIIRRTLTLQWSAEVTMVCDTHSEALSELWRKKAKLTWQSSNDETRLYLTLQPFELELSSQATVPSLWLQVINVKAIDLSSVESNAPFIKYDCAVDFHLESIGDLWQNLDEPVKFYLHFQPGLEYAYWTQSGGPLSPVSAAEESEDMIFGGYPGFSLSIAKNKEGPGDFGPMLSPKLDFSVRPIDLHGSGWGSELMRPFMALLSSECQS